MNKAQALQAFWSSFGISAWDNYSVPDEETFKALGIDGFPRITYEAAYDAFGGTPFITSASLWYHSSSWEAISLKADEISARIGFGGIVLPVDDGYIWLQRGTPFARRMDEPEDDGIRRIVLNIESEFLTTI